MRSGAIDTDGSPSLTPGAQVAVWWSRSQQDGLPFRADRVLPFAGPRYALPMPDEAMLTAMRSLCTGDVDVLSAEPAGGGLALVCFAALRNGRRWTTALPLPSSTRLKPWLYRTPDDAQDARMMLGIFLDEEVITVLLHGAARVEDGRVVLEPYGFGRADPREHERLIRLLGEDGWWSAHTEGGLLEAYSDEVEDPREP